MNDRIKLAEVMGYTKTKHNRWKSPCGKRVDSYPPNPFTDANDCEALIKHLESKGIEVTVEFGVVEDYVVIRRMPADPDLIVWRGDDWKQGVCKLALKVIE